MELSPNFYSRELRVFLANFSKIIVVLDIKTDPVPLAVELHSQEVISIGDLAELMNTDVMTARIAKLLDTMRHQIMVEPANLYKFLSVMKTDPSLADTADSIADECRKYVHTIVQ